jgi:hypothetical protein
MSKKCEARAWVLVEQLLGKRWMKLRRQTNAPAVQPQAMRSRGESAAVTKALAGITRRIRALSSRYKLAILGTIDLIFTWIRPGVHTEFGTP